MIHCSRLLLTSSVLLVLFLFCFLCFFHVVIFFFPAGKAGPCPSIQCIRVTLPLVHMWYHKVPHRPGQRVLLEYDPLGAPSTPLIIMRAPPSGVCLMPDSARRSNVPPPRKGSAARLRLLGGAPVLLSLCVGASSRTPARCSFIRQKY